MQLRTIHNLLLNLNVTKRPAWAEVCAVRVSLVVCCKWQQKKGKGSGFI